MRSGRRSRRKKNASMRVKTIERFESHHLNRCNLICIKKSVKPEKSKFIIARPSVNRETMPPQPHPHQWLNAFFRTGNGDDRYYFWCVGSFIQYVSALRLIKRRTRSMGVWPNVVNCYAVRGVNLQSKKSSNHATGWHGPSWSARTVRPATRIMIVRIARRARHGTRI